MVEGAKYVIRFNFTDGPAFAGMYKGALGFATSTETALRFVSVEVAERYRENGYGSENQSLSEIVTLEEAERATAS